MSNTLDPVIDQWYSHLDKGQLFYITDIDDERQNISIQHFDGDIEEMSLREWRGMNIELSEEPENWSGAMDIAERDDFGTEITDTSEKDWDEPLQDYPEVAGAGRPPGDDYGEGYMEEEPAGDADLGDTGESSGTLQERPDGSYEESLDDSWYAEYVEQNDDGLWRASLFRHDVPAWREDGFESLEEARQAVQDYYISQF